MQNNKTELQALLEISEKTGVSFITCEAITGKYFRAVINKYRMPIIGEDYDDYANAILSGEDIEVEQTAYMLGGITTQTIFESIKPLIENGIDFDVARDFFSRQVNRYLLVEDSTMLRHELAGLVNRCVLFKAQ